MVIEASNPTMEVLTHGVKVDLSTSMYWMQLNLSYPDGFVYLSFHFKKQWTNWSILTSAPIFQFKFYKQMFIHLFLPSQIKSFHRTKVTLNLHFQRSVQSLPFDRLCSLQNFLLTLQTICHWAKAARLLLVLRSLYLFAGHSASSTTCRVGRWLLLLGNKGH